MRLRWLLAAVTAGALVPLAGLSTVVTLRLADDERAAFEHRLAEAAHDLGAALDRETAATLRALAALGGSERLEQGDLAAFAREAARVQATQPTWMAVLLFRPDGRRVVDSRRGVLPAPMASADPASLAEVLASGRPAVGNLVSAGDQEHAFPVRVPILRKGQVQWVLTAVVSATAVEPIVRARGDAPGEWTRTVADRAGTVVARSHAPERHVGGSVADRLAALAGGDRRVARTVTLDGAEAYVAFSRAPQSGWTAAVMAPVAVVDGPLRRSLALIAAFGLLVLAVSAAGALVAARRIAGAIDSAASSAEALARGERPSVDPRRITEVSRLGDALRRSADLLAAHARERDEHLARAEAARAEAEAANRTKDEFLALLGHELRNPLSPIVTALHLLEQRGLAGTREHSIVRRQVAHLVRLVDDLLDVSRITRGKVTLHRQAVDVAAFVGRAVEMASDLLEQRGHHLTVDVPRGLVVSGDPDRLVQVVANLLTNAARYTPPGGNVAVRAARIGARIRIEVADDGRGLAPELLTVVFEPFVQGPRGPDRQEGGLGLGLTLVRSLVTLHGGRVEAASAGPGKGSCFAVELPAAGGAPAAVVPADPRAARARGGALRVLVVDDNADAAALLAELMRGEGHDVRVAPDGPTALELAGRFAPDVAVLDVGLPVMDGYELAARLRERLGAVPPAIIGVTGYGQERDRERSRAAGFRRHLVKPADPDALLAELAAIADERRGPAGSVAGAAAPP